MMHISYVPRAVNANVGYLFDGDAITATLGGVSETCDFSGLPDGELDVLASSLDLCPVLSARRVDGILHVELLRSIPPRPSDPAELEAWRALWTTQQLPSDLMDEPPTGDIPQAKIIWKPQSEINAERLAQAWERVRAERDRRIAAVEWARRRHLDEMELGLPTTLTEAQYTDLLQYVQALRDVPDEITDPRRDIDWPELGFDVRTGELA